MRAVPDQISRFIPPLPTKAKTPPPRPFLTLGTDGFGRSDTREALRRFFETDEAHVVVATLTGLAELGVIDTKVVDKAIRDYDLDIDADDPWKR